ncbi:uncharacterized protein QC761_0026030 [Podospora bellae-mahoneyi]|uniref:Secreted protein n=1 Tax=Podospora bellae-mahoneyi TaxID=2093777 RepID=A0ABR0FT38_9PEZI|nr:hypothetical protein QC761_0026030 [Podospora bellae-mahoneyi]
MLSQRALRCLPHMVLSLHQRYFSVFASLGLYSTQASRTHDRCDGKQTIGHLLLEGQKSPIVFLSPIKRSPIATTSCLCLVERKTPQPFGATVPCSHRTNKN